MPKIVKFTKEKKKGKGKGKGKGKRKNPNNGNKGGGGQIVLKKRKEEPNMNDITEMDADIDFEKLVHREHLKLQREYRLMEDRRHHLTGAGNALSKQAHLVEMLRDELENLETNLYNADSEEWRKVDAQSVRTILSILEFFEKTLSETNYCLKNMREMSSHVDRIIKQLIYHQLKVQAIYGRSMTVAQAERRLRILENRLYMYTTRFDTKLTSNKALREEINMMLKLRGLFYQRHTSMKRQLVKIRIRMTEIVFTATQTYEQRDELVTSIRNIREKNDKDTRQHVMEIKEFHRVLHHDAKSREFNMLKNKERQMLETIWQRDARRNLAKMEDISTSLQSYGRSFKEILTLSTYETIESLIKHYREMEQENFARFVAISDVSHEVNVLKVDTTDMGKEIEELYVASNNLDELRTDDLERCSDLIEKKEDELTQVEIMFSMYQRQMKEVLDIVNEVFKEVNASDQPILRLLGNKEGLIVKPSNAIIAMSSIETRARELVMERHTLELRKAVEVENVPFTRATAGKPTPVVTKHTGGPFVPSVIVAGRVEGEDDGDEEDSGAHILNAAEFRFRMTEKLLIKREIEARSVKLTSVSGSISDRGESISY